MRLGIWRLRSLGWVGALWLSLPLGAGLFACAAGTGVRPEAVYVETILDVSTSYPDVRGATISAWEGGAQAGALLSQYATFFRPRLAAAKKEGYTGVEASEEEALDPADTPAADAEDPFSRAHCPCWSDAAQPVLDR